jgi:polyisoprenoid-binding protein YceI
MKKLIYVFMALMIVVQVYGAAVRWHLQSEKSSVSFNIKNFGRKVDGTFAGMSADISFDEKNPAKSKIDASIKVGTINTGNKKRDKDLMSEKYFDEGKYPTIDFKSRSVSKTGDAYIAKGDLTMKGITKEIDIPFRFENMGDHGEFKGTLSLNRRDFQVGGKSKVLGDHVDIQIQAVVNK